MESRKVDLKLGYNGSKVTVLTFNIDAFSADKKGRGTKLIDVVRELEPDFVLLQEFTMDVFEHTVRALREFGYNRHMANVRMKSEDYEAIFSKHKLLSEKIEFIPFTNSRQTRGVTRGVFSVHGVQINVCTSQLERGDKTSARALIQYQYLLTLLNEAKNITIFGGDLSLPNYRLNPITLPDNCQDSWYEAGDSTAKYTIDHTTNKLSPPPFQDRPDRVIVSEGGANNQKVEDVLNITEHRNIVDPILSRRFGVIVSFALYSPIEN